MICHFISFSQTGVPGSFSKRSLESLHPFPSPPLTPASVACSFLEFPVQEPPEGSSCVRGARPCPVRSLHSNRRRCSTYTSPRAARCGEPSAGFPLQFASRADVTPRPPLLRAPPAPSHTFSPATFPSAACPPPAARAGQAPCRLRAFVPAAPSLRLMRSAAPRVAARRRVPRRLPSTPRQRARLSQFISFLELVIIFHRPVCLFVCSFV